jgi:hypothetical protein
LNRFRDYLPAVVSLILLTGLVLWLTGRVEVAEAQRDDAETRYAQVTDQPAPTITRTVTAPPETVKVTVRVTERASRSQVARSTPRATSSALGSTWDRLAQCESGGNWQINTGNGYGGGLQFSLRYWPFMANLADVNARYPWQATKAEQIAVAEVILSRQGWQAWPACSRKLGLR